MGALSAPSRTHLCCEDVLSRRGLRLPPECECRGAVAGGRTQSSAGKYVPDPTSAASVHARRPRNREGPGGAVCRSQARAASDARPPGRRWPAGWRTEPRACCRVGSCEACETHGTCDGAVGDCVRCTSPRGNVQLLGPQLREGRAQDVSAGWHDWGHLPSAPSSGTRAVSWPGRRGAGKEVRAVSKPKGRNAKVRRGKVTARKVSEVLTAVARLIRAVGVLVDALSTWIG